MIDIAIVVESHKKCALLGFTNVNDMVLLPVSSSRVPVNSQTKNIKDFGYLIGMVYRDDENALLYVSSRLAVQKGDIVAFRCTYFNNVVGKEEPHPIHVADVELMTKLFYITVNLWLY